MSLGPNKPDKERPVKALSGKRVSKERMEKFFYELSETANVTKACEASGVSRPYVYTWRKEDKEFEKRFNEAYLIGYDKLEEEAQRRAFAGYTRPVFQGGQQVGVIREYSDALAMFLLKGYKGERFRERTENINVNVEAQITEEEVKAELRAKLFS
jgi:hypothetical protein